MSVPQRVPSLKDAQPAIDCACRACGVRMIPGPQRPLCARCRPQVLADISRRSAEIRSCVSALQTSPSPSETKYETARQNLLVLVEYERQQILSTKPTAAAMLHRLETLWSERRARIPARNVGRGVRDDPSAVDWSGESAPLGRQDLSLSRANRRVEPRRSTSFTVLLQPMGVPALAVNVSQSGIYVRSHAYGPPGTPVRLVLDTPGGRLVAQGIVRRVDKPRRGFADETAGVAIHFTRPLPGYSPDTFD